MRAASVVVALALLCAPAAYARTHESSAALARALRTAGRGEVSLRYDVASLTGGAPREVRATLALEPPDRARIDVRATGESIVARADGGEWRQPATRQLIRFRPEHAVAAMRWWRVLLGEERAARERRIAPRHYALVLAGEDGAATDSAEVWLDPRGLPSRLDVGSGDGSALRYRLAGWRFTKARGIAAFRLAVPAGYESVELP